jgi:starch-binding outer membrane protein, SusD/RagB family
MVVRRRADAAVFFPPSQWLVNHFKTDSITGLPDPDHFNDKDLKNDAGYTADAIFTPYSGTLDPRLDWTVGRRGIPYLDWGPHQGNRWIRFPAYGPYTPKKNSYYKSQYGHFTDPGFWSAGVTANNINLIRFADILLWAAEVETEIGDPDKARGYVNLVRTRANNQSGWVTNEDNIPYAKAVTNNQAEFGIINDPPFTDIQPFDWVVRNDLNQTWVLLTIKADGTKVWNPYSVPNYKVGIYQNAWTDKEFARKAVRFERVLELGMEGHRFFDLVRWEIADTEINKYFEKEKSLIEFLKDGHFTKNKNEYFPIPQHQIDLSIDAKGFQHLHQNPGY